MKKKKKTEYIPPKSKSKEFVFAELESMTAKQRADFFDDAVDTYCFKCGGALNNGDCTCGES